MLNIILNQQILMANNKIQYNSKYINNPISWCKFSS